MFIGQILIYRFNTVENAKKGNPRNLFTIKDVVTEKPDEFKHAVQDALDEVPPGKGYLLVKYHGKIHIVEKNPNHPELEYIRHEIKYHPLANQFTI
jgi:hypothetical protein